jgi:hypothetical protein
MSLGMKYPTTKISARALEIPSVLPHHLVYINQLALFCLNFCSARVFDPLDTAGHADARGFGKWRKVLSLLSRLVIPLRLIWSLRVGFNPHSVPIGNSNGHIGRNSAGTKPSRLPENVGGSMKCVGSLNVRMSSSLITGVGQAATDSNASA